MREYKELLAQSTRNGVIERVVENWLTSVNERQYQIPFANSSLLKEKRSNTSRLTASVSRARDVITMARDGTPCAYQLKAGRVALTDWRKDHGEINELVTYPIDHPSVRSKKQHRPYFVTNGTVADPVLSAIVSANRFWVRNGAKPLQLVAQDELVSRFVKAHGTTFPVIRSSSLRSSISL